MTVGSLVYDNEEKAFRLEKANAKLRLYADWIHGDLERARAVQQMLLPDLTNMPMADRLEWGARFVPEEEVGGDYFDAAYLDANRVAILFAEHQRARPVGGPDYGDHQDDFPVVDRTRGHPRRFLGRAEPKALQSHPFTELCSSCGGDLRCLEHGVHLLQLRPQPRAVFDPR